MGGEAVFDAIEAGWPLEKAHRRHFHAAVAFYPWCQGRSGVMTVPTLILIGAEDDWTPAPSCQHLMADRAGKGAPLKVIVYPDATHAFNYSDRSRLNFGHHLAYDPEATADAWEKVREFLHEALNTSPGYSRQ